MRTITGTGPILEAYRRYRELNEEVGPVSAQAQSIRAGLVDRHGEVRNARDAWERDPAHAELMRLFDKSDSLCSALVAATDTIITTPATTLRGLSVKLQVALDVWPKGDDEELEYHDVAAAAVMRDAVRLLEGMLAQSADPHPDAELLTTCRAFMDAEKDMRAAFPDDGGDDDEEEDKDAHKPLFARWYDALERVTELRATTAEGVRAKAGAAHAAMMSVRGELQSEESAGLAVLADILAGAVA
jgi:hypothetical protein